MTLTENDTKELVIDALLRKFISHSATTICNVSGKDVTLNFTRNVASHHTYLTTNVIPCPSRRSAVVLPAAAGRSRALLSPS